MTKYNELVYFILDAIKAVSDDAFITEDHVLFLLNKYRSYLLKQKYEKDARKQVPASNYQNINLTLKQYGTLNSYWSDGSVDWETKQEDTTTETIEKLDVVHLQELEQHGDPTRSTRWDDSNIVKRTYLKSNEEVPYTMQLGITSCYIVDPFVAAVTVVSAERLEFVGFNRFLQRIIYGAIGPDNHFYIKSNNIEMPAIKKVVLRGILEDPTALMDDPMEEECPIEEDLIPPLIKSVIADLLDFEYRPQDPANNANDDLSDIAMFIRQNMKDKYAKQYLDGGANNAE